MYKDNVLSGASVNERPYERCELYGASSLTDAELISIILRSGSDKGNALDLANNVLNICGRDKGLKGICSLTMDELTSIHGIGRVKAMQLLCVAELSRRIALSRSKERLNCSDPVSVADYFMESLRHKETEIVRCLMLDVRNRLTDDVLISKGTVNMALISPREIFLEALRRHAVNIILAHNHPSGDPAPSREDILLTERVAEAGNMLGIRLLDHVIIGDGRYYSFAASNLIC